MEVDSVDGQRQIFWWSLAVGAACCIPMYLFGLTSQAQGMLFGLFLTIINFRSLSKLLTLSFRFNAEMARIIIFLSYHIRFWLIVLIMYIIIPKTNLYFGIGTFLGLLIPKAAMGPIVYQKRSAEWWSQKFPACEPPRPALSNLERELLKKNPFEVDPVEVEIKRCFSKVRE